VFTYPLTNEHPITPIKALFFAALCAVWLCAGLVGHDPWKPDEAYSFGVVYQMLESGDWLVPSLAGEPFMDKPPLFYISAALSAKLFAPWLPLHDGARLVSGMYSALTLMFIGFAGRELFGKGRGWAAAIILIGCLGMLVRAHQLITDLALISGCAMMLYGYALSLRRTLVAALWLGTGVGLGFMAKGFIAPMLFVFISVALLVFQNWRTRAFFTTCGLALLFALPWLSLWPVLLYQRSPELFYQWAWTLNIGRWFGYAHEGHFPDALYYVKSLPWLAWPALPLAVWVVWDARKKVLHEAEFQLLLVSFLVMLVTLSVVPNIKEVFALPMLLPLTLLATASLSTLRRGAANALDWFGMMTFGVLAILMWWGWAGLLLNNHAKVTLLLKEYHPDFTPTFELIPFCIALAFTALWLLLVWRVRHSIRRAVINWAVGVTLIWVLAMTLWLPWLDSGKSYRNMVAELKFAIPVQHQCIRESQLGDGVRAMLHYFGGLILSRDAGCDLVLVQGNLPQDPAWKLVWEGGRAGDKNERYRLYQRKP
jgi:4-amino-4-deoxy-L-arabinose transferase-like glycosyltransferase